MKTLVATWLVVVPCIRRKKLGESRPLMCNSRYEMAEAIVELGDNSFINISLTLYHRPCY